MIDPDEIDPDEIDLNDYGLWRIKGIDGFFTEGSDGELELVEDVRTYIANYLNDFSDPPDDRPTPSGRQGALTDGKPTTNNGLGLSSSHNHKQSSLKKTKPIHGPGLTIQPLGVLIVTKYIAGRRGQAAFRDKLLNLYNRTCVVTDCPIEDLLEAAHLVEHSKTTNYKPDNGLLLRCDIHTMFDLNLIGIEPHMKVDDKVVSIVRLHPSCDHKPYTEYKNKEITLSADWSNLVYRFEKFKDAQKLVLATQV